MLNKNFIAALFCLLLSFTSAKADQPNVLFIAVDDMNDWIGSLNSRLVVGSIVGLDSNCMFVVFLGATYLGPTCDHPPFLRV